MNLKFYTWYSAMFDFGFGYPPVLHSHPDIDSRIQSATDKPSEAFPLHYYSERWICGRTYPHRCPVTMRFSTSRTFLNVLDVILKFHSKITANSSYVEFGLHIFGTVTHLPLWIYLADTWLSLFYQLFLIWMSSRHCISDFVLHYSCLVPTESSHIFPRKRLWTRSDYRMW